MEGLVPPLLLVGTLLVFWLLVVRPGVRRERERRAMQTALQPGDRVVLTSGFFGAVVAVHDDRAEIEIAPGTVVTVALGAVGALATEVTGTTDPTDPTGPTGPTRSTGKTDPAGSTGPAAGSTRLDKNDPRAPQAPGTEES